MKSNSLLPRITSLFCLFSGILIIGIMPVLGQTSNSAHVQWAPNEEKDLAGYRVYHGTVSGQYGNSTDVGLHDTYDAPDLDPNKTHFFAITAYDKDGNESMPSQEVYKKFLPDYSPLTINLQGSGTVRSNSGGVTCRSGSCTTAVTFGTELTLIATPSDGQIFSGWSGACSGTSKCVVVLDDAQDVTAKFSPIQIVLTTQVNGLGRVVSATNTGDLVCPRDTCKVELPYDTKVTMTATPNDGAVFSGWSGACSGTGKCFVVLEDAQHVTATFTSIPIVLTMQVTGLGSVNGVTSEGKVACARDTCKVEMPHGTKVTLTATPSDGGEFSGWSGACRGTGNCAVVMEEAEQVTATFTPIPIVLTMQVTGLGSVSGVTNEGKVACARDSCKIELPYRTKVTMTATPNDGAVFSGWSGVCSGTGNCAVVLDKAQSVTAVFKHNGSVSGISDPSPGSILTNDSVTFTGGHTNGDVRHALWVGTTKGGRNLFKGGIANHQQLVSKLPRQGTIYVRYWSLKGKDSRDANAWSFKEHVYTMAVRGNDENYPPSLSSPSPGATLTNTSVTFTGGHTAGDVRHALWVGTTKGGRNLFKGGIVNHRQLVSKLPRQGTIYVRYWSLKSKDSSSNANAWSFKEHVYTMAVGGNDENYPPSLSSPHSGSTLTSTSVLFTGGHTAEDTMHSLWVGTTKGGRNLFKGGITNHRQLVSKLPRQGTIYVRYWSLKSNNSSNANAWSFKDHVYKMNAGGN